MVSESTLRILEDVGELRLYQQEDKDPGVARVRFGTSTLDQLENPVGFQSQLTRQYSIDSEKSVAIARQDSKITVNLATTEEDDEDKYLDEGSRGKDEKDKEDLPSCLTGQSSAASSTTELVSAQVHDPSPLKSLAKDCVLNNGNDDCLDIDPQYQLQSVNSSCVSL